MIPKYPFRYTVGDLLSFPKLIGDKGGTDLALIVEAPDEDDVDEQYKVFDFFLGNFRYITVGSYFDRHSRRVE